MTNTPWPYFTSGTIVHGFGRGSKELGCPTANFDEETVDKLPSSIDQGVYYGWAKLLTKRNNEIYKMVTSVGTNPFYNGEKKSMETHIIHEFPEDFYGETLKIVLLGEIRKMTTFNNAGMPSKRIQSISKYTAFAFVIPFVSIITKGECYPCPFYSTLSFALPLQQSLNYHLLWFSVTYFFLFDLGELVTAIQNDISTAKKKLDSDECRQYHNHSFFQ
ncbi:unnamed protein product [Adineta ricciae]|uniref:riboflavin kinase n=1 Tax=Adineta ricciae TaxID=249248 RepID=A0A813VQW5_ADIRI|nr:unnamed protein product [Adineta ricciae]